MMNLSDDTIFMIVWIFGMMVSLLLMSIYAAIDERLIEELNRDEVAVWGYLFLVAIWPIVLCILLLIGVIYVTVFLPCNFAHTSTKKLVARRKEAKA